MPIESRTIQYFGILKAPPTPNLIKFSRLYFDLKRRPFTEYKSVKTNEPTYFYGYAQIVKNNRITRKIQLEFINQEFYSFDNLALWLYQTTSCTHEAVLTSFKNTSEFFASFPPYFGFVYQRNNPIKTWQNIPFPWDEIWLKFPDEFTIAEISHFYEYQETCDVPESVPPVFPASPPIPSNTPLPPDTPNSQFLVSPPYSSPNDSGRTYNPGPPGIADCTPVNVTFRYFLPSGQEAQTFTVQRLAPINGIRGIPSPVFGQQAEIQLLDRGASSGQCLSESWGTVANVGTIFGSFQTEIISIIPI